VSHFLEQIFNFAGTFNLELLVLLYVACIFGEIWFIAVPYLLETVWLLAGYNVGRGVISPTELLILWLVAQAGRQSGVLLLSSISRLGSIPLMKIYQKWLDKRLAKQAQTGKESSVTNILSKMDSYISPFSVALGRLLGLGTLMTIALGVKKKRKVLVLGVLLASVVFDGIFILFGLFVGTNKLVKPVDMLLFSVIGLSALYLLIFSGRRLYKYIKKRFATPQNPLG
jgi:membrane-associated protein